MNAAATPSYLGEHAVDGLQLSLLAKEYITVSVQPVTNLLVISDNRIYTLSIRVSNNHHNTDNCE